MFKVQPLKVILLLFFQECSELLQGITPVLVEELLGVCETSLGFTLTEDEKRAVFDGLHTYSLSIYDYHGAVKEWKWRNGWLTKQPSHPQGVHHRLLFETVPELYQPK